MWYTPGFQDIITSTALISLAVSNAPAASPQCHCLMPFQFTVGMLMCDWLPFLVSCRDSTQLSPTIMQRAALQAFLDLEDIMSQDVKFSQLRFAFLPSSDQMGSGTWLQLLSPYFSFFHSYVGPVDATRIIVSENLISRSQLLLPIFKTVETGFLHLETTSVKATLHTLLPSSGYAFCSGIPRKDYDDKSSVIRYDPKHVRKMKVRNQERIDADTCHVWFQATPGFTLLDDSTLASP